MCLCHKCHTDISIHTPHAGSDLIAPVRVSVFILISIHTPHAGSDRGELCKVHRGHHISIHTPHAGSDVVPDTTAQIFWLFQSTLPMRGVTADCMPD